MPYLTFILSLAVALASPGAFAKSEPPLKQFGLEPPPAVEYSPAQKKASFAGCTDLFPQGKPLEMQTVAREMRPVALCSDTFAVVYSQRTKTPLVAIEKLNRAQLDQAKGVARTDVFFADPRLTLGSARSQDYSGSGFDRGHLAAAGGQPHKRAMVQSFALSNVVPQDPTNNQKIWRKVEQDVRKYARRAKGDVYIYSGPLFNGPVQTIGVSKVWVPSHLFKLVYDPEAGRAWAYIVANTSDALIGKPVDYEEFVRQTGWKLLPV